MVLILLLFVGPLQAQSQHRYQNYPGPYLSRWQPGGQICRDARAAIITLVILQRPFVSTDSPIVSIVVPFCGLTNSTIRIL